MNKQKFIIGLIILGISVLIIGLFIALPNNTLKTNDASSDNFVFDEVEFDFGIVKQSGGIVQHDFPFTYNGTTSVEVTGVPTSCGCTSAIITPSALEPGTKGIITVSFDPNLHAEPEGKFFKTITLLTEPELNNVPELKIWAEIDLDLGPEFYKEAIHEGEILLEIENLAPEKDYQTISAATLKEALEDKHFFLVDVHTPEQSHIEGTDAVIPFDQIGQELDQLPQDKDETIILYCRSGSMSQQAAQALVDEGYTNVIHVEGGIQAFNELQ